MTSTESRIVGLTLHQPWATLMAIGAKRIETRSWPTSYRGLVAIHAAKTFPSDAREFCRGDVPYFYLTDVCGWEAEELPLGAVVATGILCECLPAGEVVDNLSDYVPEEGQEEELLLGDYSRGRWAWVFRDVREINPTVPCRGALGLWAVPADIRARLGAAV